MHTKTRPHIRLGALEVQFLVEAEDSGGSATAFETLVPVGSNVPPPHSHDGFEEIVYGLRGVLTFTVDGDEHQIGPGQSLCIRRGQVHRFDNRSTVDGAFLSVATPGVFGPDYFQDIADVLSASAGGPPDIAAIKDVMRRHGLTLAVPPA